MITRILLALIYVQNSITMPHLAVIQLMHVIKWPRSDSDGSCVNKMGRGYKGFYSIHDDINKIIMQSSTVNSTVNILNRLIGIVSLVPILYCTISFLKIPIPHMLQELVKYMCAFVIIFSLSCRCIYVRPYAYRISSETIS